MLRQSNHFRVGAEESRRTIARKRRSLASHVERVACVNIKYILESSISVNETSCQIMVK